MLVPVLAVGFSACGGASEIRETAGITVQTEDSAGVRIVQYDGMPELDAPFQFPAEPLYRHGTNPGDYNFQRIHPGSLFPDGSAVVSDIANEELVVLSPDGTSHEVIAGPGEGPGDVDYVGATFALGQDRFLAVDQFLNRLTIFAGGSGARWTSGTRIFAGGSVAHGGHPARGRPGCQGNRRIRTAAYDHEFVHVRL